jgi:tRNA-2-methylthio-N6-dimethylallyladenosine synthase
MIIGPQSYHKINDLILKYEIKKEKINETEFDVVGKFDELKKISNSQSKVSSYLTIQEGCDKFCHFCVVPYTRGPEYSRPFEQIIYETKNLVSKGAREIILLGQNVNAYNYNNSHRLSSLIRTLSNIKNLKRIRFTTSHPKDMTEDLIDCYRDCEKLMPFLHLPIQSGSNKILKLMNRKHDREYYISIIEKLKKINKNIKISSDFIVGYPGETENDFQDTMKLINKVGFVNSYSFIFSPRPGTPAATKKLANLSESKLRLKKLQNTLDNFQHKNNKEHLQQNCEVLIENKLNNQEKYFGRTRYMTPVVFEADNCKFGDIINVKITSCSQKSLFGIHETNKVKAA